MTFALLLLAASAHASIPLPADSRVTGIPEVSFYYCVKEDQVTAQMKTCKNRMQESLGTLQVNGLTILKIEECTSRRSEFFCETETGQGVQNGHMVTGKIQFIR